MGSEHHLPKWLSRSLLPAYYTLFFNPCHLFHKVSRGHHLGASFGQKVQLCLEMVRGSYSYYTSATIRNSACFPLLTLSPRVALDQKKTFQLPSSTVPQTTHTAGSHLKGSTSHHYSDADDLIVAIKQLSLVAQSYPTLCNSFDLQPAQLLCPWDFSGKNTGVGCHFPPPGDLPDPGIKPAAFVPPALQADSLPTEPLGKGWQKQQNLASCKGSRILLRSHSQALDDGDSGRLQALPLFLSTELTTTPHLRSTQAPFLKKPRAHFVGLQRLQGQIHRAKRTICP